MQIEFLSFFVLIRRIDSSPLIYMYWAIQGYVLKRLGREVAIKCFSTSMQWVR